MSIITEFEAKWSEKTYLTIPPERTDARLRHVLHRRLVDEPQPRVGEVAHHHVPPPRADLPERVFLLPPVLERQLPRGLLGPLDGQQLLVEEAINTPFCSLQEKFRTFVLRGLRNISDAP